MTCPLPIHLATDRLTIVGGASATRAAAGSILGLSSCLIFDQTDASGSGAWGIDSNERVLEFILTPL